MGMQDLILLFPSSFHTQLLQLCEFQFSRILRTQLPLFRSLTDSKILHSAISARLVRNNSLIHLLRILTSLVSYFIFLYLEFYSKHPVLTDVFNNGTTVIGEKLFCSFESVFELARGLRDSQASINKKAVRSTSKESVYL